jgi:thiosulfate dehydrogenase
MRRTTTAPVGVAALLALAGAAGAAEVPRHRAPADKDALVVQLCDGETELAVAGKQPGDTLTRDEAQRASDELMRAWGAKQDPRQWAAWVKENDEARAAAAERAAASAATPAADAGPGQPVKFSERDKLLWKREESKLIAEGYKLYHSAPALGGTIGVSCDMCHPDGANTHPETYPKFQVQLKKVALLRDMINWCIENPGRGKPLPENDPRLRAVEAYITSTRKGVPLEPGKH